MRILTSTLFLALLLGSITFAQEVDKDYEAYPDLPFELEHLMLNVTVEPASALIKGIARYDISSRREILSEVVLHTSDLEIQDISIGDQQLAYQVSGDSLVIELKDTLGVGDRTQFHITWQSNSSFGIHTDGSGNLWTSLQPKATHHWFPVFDHPEVETTIDAHITIPADKEAVFVGKFNGHEIISTDKKRVHWRSQVPVPVTGISLAVGNFAREEATSGIKDISVFAGESVLIREVRDGLMQMAVSTLRELERKLSYEYPFESLNIVVLPDNLWDEQQTEAGVIYLYQNLGSLTTQLRRGISEQWLGQHHRYLDRGEKAMNYEFLKASLLRDTDVGQLKNSDSLQTINAWNHWVEGYKSLENNFLKKTVENSLPELVKLFSGVTGWNNYADYFYQKTGAYWDTLPEIQKTTEEPAADFSYDVEYIYDEANSTLNLVFKAEGKGLETLAGVEVREIDFSDTTVSEISFTGLQDTIKTDISPAVEYVLLSPKGDANIKLNEHKPFPFLLNQLRSAEAEERAEAATGLINFAENPDLQLALRDVLNNEENPTVRAALLETLAEILNGAIGTEQTFLDAARTDAQEIQVAAIKALSNYEGNEEVQYAIRNMAIRAESDTIFNTALRTYNAIAKTEDKISLAERLENADTAAIRSLKVLNMVAEEDTSGQALEAADRFLNKRYPYLLRKKALDLLLLQQNDSDYWERSLNSLITDRDPRIRFLSLKAIEKIPATTAQEILTAREKEEFDPRVLEKIKRLK
ncbi:MAG: hypothetical protein WD059_02635 [Balneolaceae bacterium]